MKILAIDTSGQTASVALVNEYITIGEFSANPRDAKHSEILLPMLDKLFEFTGLTIHDMDTIACVSGPGSFTGLRIGAATAMGLAQGSGNKLVAVPALDALAYNMCNAFGFIMPMLDARREQVYTALYKIREGLPQRVSDYVALPVSEALKKLNGEPVLFLGDGASAYESVIREQYPKAIFAVANANRQRAASAGVCALHMLRDGYKMQSSIECMYIRKPQAEREREEKCLT